MIDEFGKRGSSPVGKRLNDPVIDASAYEELSAMARMVGSTPSSGKGQSASKLGIARKKWTPARMVALALALASIAITVLDIRKVELVPRFQGAAGGILGVISAMILSRDSKRRRANSYESDQKPAEQFDDRTMPADPL